MNQKKTKSVSYFVSYLFHRYQLRSSWPFKIKIKLARAFHPVSLGKHSALLWYFYKFPGHSHSCWQLLFTSGHDLIHDSAWLFSSLHAPSLLPKPFPWFSDKPLAQSRAVHSIPLARVREMVLNHRNSKNLKLGLIFIFLNSCSLMTVSHGCFLIQFPLFRNYWKKIQKWLKSPTIGKELLKLWEHHMVRNWRNVIFK